ncbi:hypothetical protein LEM8419_03419 [Neolewinella maritima]|uniref:Conjugative transposon TraM C-terminal domain-containing protein n=1 Tax=Neolewinella maritima TaxID=1383882 RepID=A0ABN8F6H4_9BACT|nr:conjugative transposon protein TraM [Neolewinella maritima]CAH1002545.1 hypothetical protein LEM8419_03419 [Neolewinella maritima]
MIDTTIDTADPAEFERKKKFFTFLPLFVLPILILLFWALDGGKGNAAELGDGGGGATNGPVSQVKTDLPGAIVEREESKRGVYEREAKERERRRYDMARDPYADQLQETDSPGAIASGIDAWEQRFNARTGNLQRELDSFDEAVAGGTTSPAPPVASSDRQRSSNRNQPAATSSSRRRRSAAPTNLAAEEEDEQVRQIEEAIAKLNGGDAFAASYGTAFAPSGAMPGMDAVGNAPDGGIPMTAQDSAAYKQVEALDRIMERAHQLQYPELAREEIRKRSEKNARHLYPVADAPTAAGEIEIFGATPRRDTVAPPVAQRQVGFFTDNAGDQSDNFTQLTVRAQVHNSAIVMDGSTVKMRLLEDVYVAGQRIPANTFVYGQCGLRGDRLSVVVSTINFRSNVYDVGLNVYDLDGQEGLAVPGSVERQIAKREAAASARRLGGTSIGAGSLTEQLAAQGTQTIKEITSRKISVIKVELKAGHRVILRNQ